MTVEFQATAHARCLLSHGAWRMYADIANYDPSPDMQAMFDNVWNGEYTTDGQHGLAKELWLCTYNNL